ncbi:MAG TPA: response regulator [Gemmatimonadales bacterium]|nr:response regulator [Gemmatimonadales bacterium]
MAPRTPFSRPPVVLAVSVAGTRLRQALATLLKPQGYRVQFVSSGRELLERAAAVGPDIVVLDTDLPDLDAVSVCRALRQNRVAWDMPVMMIASLSPTKGQRRAALEAGAWDYLSVVLAPEELRLKLDAMARLKLDLERALEHNSMDPVSGLYTRRGLERRARELTADAFRRRSPLACVALGIEPAPKDAPGAVAYAATVLQASARASDAIGDLTEGAFAVLAPATSPEHALSMARRLSRVIETAGPRPAGVPPLQVHAGYEAAANLHETPIEPVSLIEHAGAALIQARAAGPGERIRAYGAL